MNYRLPLLYLLLLLLGCSTHAHSMNIAVKEVKLPSYGNGWLITSAQASPGEFTYSTYLLPQHYVSYYMRAPGGPTTAPGCYHQSPTPVGCLYGRLPPKVWCETAEQAAIALPQLVGYGVVMPTKTPPAIFMFFCADPSSNTRGWLLTASLNAAPAPVSCNASDALITIRGSVGERAKATTNLNIQCDSPATVRLTLSDGGLVSLGGDGQVRLSFGKNGRDVLDVSGTAPLVEVEGELTKSPTTAGTYQGSSVLRLDIL